MLASLPSVVREPADGARHDQQPEFPVNAATDLITDAPAPWQLKGRGYICLLRAPQELLDRQSFVPPSLLGKRGRAPYALMMFVDYSESPVGPYHELLFIPGSFPFEDGRRHQSISRIFVSSMDSVVNGQRNWGIPKDVAQFDVRYRDNGLDRVRVARNGKTFAELDFKSWPIPLPFSTALLPGAMHTLGQHADGRAFIYRPTASGWVRPASLRRSWIDPSEFPDITRAKPLVTVEVASFNMRFPQSAILPLAAGRSTD